MKVSIVILFIMVFGFARAQNVFPYVDNRQYFKSFKEGFSTQIDHLPPIEYKYSEEIIAFIDNKSDLMIFDGKKSEKLSGMANGYEIGINLVAWNTGPVISVWENGQKQILTYFGRRYEVSDSLVVFEDERDNAIRVYYRGNIYDLYYSVGRPYFPQYIGPNTVVFEGNGGVYYAFNSGKILEIGSFNGPAKFAPGANLVVFNDPFNQSFAVAFREEALDVETMNAIDYQAGYDIFAYTDINHNLKAYIDGELVELSSNASFYQVYRDLIVWGENNTFFTYNNGTRYEIANYIPDEFQLRDQIVAFRNLNGGVSVFHNNKVEIVSNLTGAPFKVNGNTVQVQVSKGNFDYFKNGYRYQD